MGDFFKSVRFKILVGVLVVMTAFLLRAASEGSLGILLSGALGAVSAPFQEISARISDTTTGFFSRFFEAGRLEEENTQLKEDIRKLQEKVVDYEACKQENAQLKESLNITEQNPGFVLENATVIGRSPNDLFYSFTIDKGKLDGISKNDPVITKDGLVGVISDVGMTFAKVTTILDASRNIGAFDSSTMDTGIVTGTVDLAQNGRCKMSYIKRESTIANGDIVTTSGIGGQFPKSLIIGTVVDVKTESSGTLLYAVLDPSADIINCTEVMVLKDFKGKGSDVTQNDFIDPSQPGSSSSSSGSGDASDAGTSSEPAQ